MLKDMHELSSINSRRHAPRPLCHSLTSLLVQGCNLNGAFYDISGFARAGWLCGARLGPVQWKECDLVDAKLMGCDLGDADMRGADLSGADLTGANLSGADLSGATIDAEIACPAGWLLGALLGPVDWSWKSLQGAQLQVA